jgi:hypothetical protein
MGPDARCARANSVSGDNTRIPGIGATPIMSADCFNILSRTFLKGASIQHSACHVAART